MGLLNNKNIPSVDELRSLLRHDPKTGKMYWLGKKFDTRWNSKYKDKEAFCTDNNGGYLTGEFRGIAIKAHRVLWALTYGEWPELFIDHINGNRRDNRIENLRSVTSDENRKNIGISKKNSSGHIGVSFDRKRSKWKAAVTVGRRNINLGRFDNINDAVAARQVASIKYGFHENHGSIR